MMRSTDIWFCAFLLFRGYKIESYNKVAPKKVECSFSIAPNDWQQLKLEFNNSDFIKFKALTEQIKDLSY